MLSVHGSQFRYDFIEIGEHKSIFRFKVPSIIPAANIFYGVTQESFMFKKSRKLFSKKSTEENRVTPVATTPLFDAYRRANEQNFHFLMRMPDASVDQKKLEATQRFNEFLWRLDQRYQQLKAVESFIYDADSAGRTVPMRDVQLEFVNRIEAYYQQLYASLSAFAMFVNHVAPHSFRRGLPIGGIEEFLRFLRTKTALNIDNELTELERARDFRARFVDHTQQHALHNWMTFSYPTGVGQECVVIYYISQGPEVFFRPHTNPYAPDFRPPVNYESFYVSPPHNECHKALFGMCQKVIRQISEPDPSI